MQKNKYKMYEIVIVQCNPKLKSTLKGDSKYISKYKLFDVILLLNKVKKKTLGLYIKANSSLTLY